MKALNLLVGSLSAFVMLTACGEGFKANLAGSSLQERETPVTQDQETLNEVKRDYLNLDAVTNAQLMSDISSGAFEIEIDVNSTRAGDTLSSIKATVQGFDCNLIVPIINTTLNHSEFRSEQMFALGTQGQYRVEAQCNNSVCSEMTASLQRTDSQGEVVAVVLYGLKAAAKVLKANGTGYTQQYVVQPVNIEGFGTSSTFLEKQNRCNTSEFSQTQSTGTGSLIDPTTGNGFTELDNTGAFGTTTSQPAFTTGSGNFPF